MQPKKLWVIVIILISIIALVSCGKSPDRTDHGCSGQGHVCGMRPVRAGLRVQGAQGRSLSGGDDRQRGPL